MSDFDPLVTLIETGGEFEARTIVAVLEDAGIEAHVFVLGNLGLPQPLSPGARGIPVMVRQSRREFAERVLAESRELGASVDWESVDVGDEPPFPPRRRGLRSIMVLGSGVLLVAAAASMTAVGLGASQSSSARIFMITVAVAFVTLAISSGMREWRDARRDSHDRAHGPEGPGRQGQHDPHGARSRHGADDSASPPSH